MPWIQQLSRPRKGSKDDVPLMQMRFPKVSSLDTTAIKCQACQLGKARRRLDNVTVERVREDRDGGLKKEILRVGSKVATDQFVSSVKGHRFDTKGKEPDGQRFTGGTIFVDISSGYMEVHPQVSLRAQDTIIRKQRFERNLNNVGHSVQMYLGDNGEYRSKEFMNDLKDRGQTVEFCGVGAHHQNDVAEQAIRTVSEAARNMMIHAAIHWPGNVDAVHIYNQLPNMKTGVSPLEIMTGSRMDGSELRTSRIWGCPAYVFDPKVI